MEYYYKPPIPPPFVVFYNFKYIYQLVTYLLKKCSQAYGCEQIGYNDYEMGEQLVNGHGHSSGDPSNSSSRYNKTITPEMRREIKKKEGKTNSLTMYDIPNQRSNWFVVCRHW